VGGRIQVSVAGAPAGLTGGHAGLDPVAEQILDGAHAEITDHGLRRTSIDAIARRAGVGRATVFRRFATRDALLGALIAREAQRLIAAVDHDIAACADPADRIVTGFLAFVRHLRRHPFARLLITDPAEVLPRLTVDADAPMALGRHYLAQEIRRARSEGAPIAADPDELAELLARIALSFLLTPASVLPLDDPERLAQTARTTIVPLIIGHVSPAPSV
jgi:AcrR family transcriptional regulator